MRVSTEVEQIIKHLCDKHKINIEMFMKLLQTEQDVRHLTQRSNIAEILRHLMKDYVMEERL